MLERVIDDGVADFGKVKSAIGEFEAEYHSVIDRYEITANPGIAAKDGYYIALNTRLGDISWDRLELPEEYNGIPVAVRRRK